MAAETYTPGHTSNAAQFMAQRTFATHGAFFAAQLRQGMSVLDLGCGPGSITIGLAELVAPGRVTGIDFAPSQIDRAKIHTTDRKVRNFEFVSGSCYELPFGDDSFDAVFSHALLEHLSDPIRALRECRRVLKPGGMIGVCSPDWGGFVLAPPSRGLSDAIAAYTDLQTKNGGDVNVGRKLGSYLEKAGFEDITMSARYECYPSPELIGEYLALQLDVADATVAAQALRDWSRGSGGLFAQTWVAAVGAVTK